MISYFCFCFHFVYICLISKEIKSPYSVYFYHLIATLFQLMHRLFRYFDIPFTFIFSKVPWGDVEVRALIHTIPWALSCFWQRTIWKLTLSEQACFKFQSSFVSHKTSAARQTFYFRLSTSRSFWYRLISPFTNLVNSKITDCSFKDLACQFFFFK